MMLRSQGKEPALQGFLDQAIQALGKTLGPAPQKDFLVKELQALIKFRGGVPALPWWRFLGDREKELNELLPEVLWRL